LFAPGGTSAIGMALKLARVATGRFKFVSMWDAFHGASLDAISVSGEATFRQGIGPLLPGCEHVPPPDPGHCPFKCGATCSLACAAALATLDVIADEKLVEHARVLGERTLTALRKLASRHSLIDDVRGLGLLLGVELKGDRATEEAGQVMYAALARGLSFKVT